MSMKGWKAEQGCLNSIVVVDLDGGPDVCEIVAEGDENTPEEWERAYIIAAAPDMLKALEFYADPKRYKGANQRAEKGEENIGGYRIDVTRDNGERARAVLAKKDGWTP